MNRESPVGWRASLDQPASAWARLPADEVAARLESPADGLSTAEAEARVGAAGPNALTRKGHPGLVILARQFRNPLLALLLVAAGVSFGVGERLDAGIIVGILTLSVALGFFDEYRADRSARVLEGRLTRTARVIRSGEALRIPIEQLAPGDVIVVEAGDIVSADSRLIEATELALDESVLTGESLPADKHSTPDPKGEELATMLLSGTTVRSGRGKAIVVATGQRTMFAGIASSLEPVTAATEFERGLRRFSLFLVVVTAILTTFIFVTNAVVGRSVLSSFLFSLAIAVGLTPQLLPAIVTVSLATGGRRMAARKVIVRHMVAIEDLGNLELLFSDKTGTLTQGSIELEELGAPEGAEQELLAWTSAWLLTGANQTSANVLDSAIAADSRVVAASTARDGWRLLAELPFSYERRDAAISVATEAGNFVAVKGAAEEVLERCSSARNWGNDWRKDAEARLAAMNDRGLRVIAVAVKPAGEGELAQQVRPGLELMGFLGFADPPRPDARAAIDRLEALGIELKVLTGDHPAVAKHVCALVDIDVRGAITGAEIEGLDEAQLRRAVAENTIFARVTPDQKRALVKAAQAGGRDVGFLGDGVNDAPALHQADIGISVNDATDVAKAAADVVLLEKDLDVLATGVLEGRRTFANTVKYVLMATSSNFGNMFSAAGASLFLSFLPMLPTQILLNNFLYDVSELTLPTDQVDEELTHRPAHWDLHTVGRFMLVFGPSSSIYDFLTFGLMLGVFNAKESLFQSGWFVESLCTQTLVIFVLRTRRVPFWRSRPSSPLLMTTITCVVVAVAIPFTPLAGSLGFTSLPVTFLLALAVMVVTYLALVETAKRWFYGRWPGFSDSTEP